jgi:hypothetical protein
MTKHVPFRWYRDKPLWTNLVALVAAAGAYFTGDADQGTALATGVLALANLILRLLGRTEVPAPGRAH